MFYNVTEDNFFQNFQLTYNLTIYITVPSNSANVKKSPVNWFNDDIRVMKNTLMRIKGQLTNNFRESGDQIKKI